MTQTNDGVETTNAVVVTMDICSSTSIIEDLLKSERIRIWRDLIISMKDHLRRYSGPQKVELYKFIGDGWLILFHQPYLGQEILAVLETAADFYNAYYEREIFPRLDTPPKLSGLMFGIAEGQLIKIEMLERTEYVGRAINIACRLQGSINEYDVNSGFRVLMSHGLFHQLKDELENYYHKQTEKPLKNLSDGKTFLCYQILLDDGLKIVEARYGSKVNDIDVTFQYASRVRNNKLHVLVSNEVAGEDPDRGAPKMLRITCSWLGQLHYDEFEEGAWADLP